MSQLIMTERFRQVRQMVSFTLKITPEYDVIEASDARTPLSKLSGPIKMVITDLNMPNMDGISLIKNIRANPAYKFVPIVMLTTESQATKKQDGKDAGATGWIDKPFKPDQLLPVVKKVLR
jgi:two-component system chemotaxis response regulator CheY